MFLRSFSDELTKLAGVNRDSAGVGKEYMDQVIGPSGAPKSSAPDKPKASKPPLEGWKRVKSDAGKSFRSAERSSGVGKFTGAGLRGMYAGGKGVYRGGRAVVRAGKATVAGSGKILGRGAGAGYETVRKAVTTPTAGGTIGGALIKSQRGLQRSGHLPGGPKNWGTHTDRSESRARRASPPKLPGRMIRSFGKTLPR